MNTGVPQCQLLYEATVDIGEREDLGVGPQGQRYIIPILGGSFEGPHGLRGIVQGGGADRQLLRLDRVK